MSGSCIKAFVETCVDTCVDTLRLPVLLLGGGFLIVSFIVVGTLACMGEWEAVLKGLPIRNTIAPEALVFGLAAGAATSLALCHYCVDEKTRKKGDYLLWVPMGETQKRLEKARAAKLQAEMANSVGVSDLLWGR